MRSAKHYQRVWQRKQLRQHEGYHSKNCLCRNCVASQILDSSHRILDVGCGTGHFAPLIKNKCELVYGVDFSSEALTRARARGVRTKKVDLNTDTLPFQDEWFDAVTCLDVIEHVQDPNRLMNEMNRVLRLGGCIIISCPNIIWWGHLLSLLIFRRFPRTSDDTEAYDGGHIHYFTYRDIEEMLERHGFKVIEKRGVLGKSIFKEFRSPGIVVKARKVKAVL